MNLIITGHQFELSKKDKRFIHYKVSSKLEPFLDQLHNVKIVIEREHNLIKSECSVTSDLGEFFASSHHEYLEKSVDQTLTKMITELKKRHAKNVAHHVKPMIS